jgi:hypothetical protein
MRMSGVQVRHGYTEHMPERESWAKESFEIATKIAYRNDGRIRIPKSGNQDGTSVTGAPVLPAGYVRIANRRITIAGYRLADLFIQVTQN